MSRADAEARALIKAQFRDDREAQRRPGTASGSSKGAMSTSDLMTLALERKRRDEAREAGAAKEAVAAGQRYPSDPTLMRGEAEARAAGIVKRWDLCDKCQNPLAHLEPAGLRHLGQLSLPPTCSAPRSWLHQRDSYDFGVYR